MFFWIVTMLITSMSVVNDWLPSTMQSIESSTERWQM